MYPTAFFVHSWDASGSTAPLFSIGNFVYGEMLLGYVLMAIFALWQLLSHTTLGEVEHRVSQEESLVGKLRRAGQAPMPSLFFVGFSE